MQELKNIIKLIDDSIKNDANNLIMFWWIIKDWFDNEVDELRNLVNNSNEWLNDYTQKLINDTWINTLKIKYTQVSWYFIEVPLSQKSKIPNYFNHKTTLVNAMRFVTQELSNFESKITNAESLLYEKEYSLFKNVSNSILESFKEIKKVSWEIANIDFLTWLSEVAYQNNYSKPELNSNYDLEIIDWRHSVIEKIEKTFISNDLTLNKNKFINIITWPNMWWKSTYLRQNALIILLAHIWSFVPAKSAKIPLTDKIFSRIWAQDNLFLWTSTFMVEMQEVANILNNSTKNSFVIIDEVWRWTSTYDGMSLAWAILKQNHDNIKAKTLFATHYHELVINAKKLSWTSNYSVAVSENDEWVVFLRKIVPWSIKKSYWIEVARLAWLPVWVIDEAKIFLKNMENQNNFNQMTLWFWSQSIEKIVYKEIKSKIEEEIKNIDLDNLTPIEAINIINSWKKSIKENDK